ncbi:MAG: hypothetical protein N4A64_02185 [Marinisporobacter sp.]|nr:hypothetical protein [Marinisporobacter sp.]
MENRIDTKLIISRCRYRKNHKSLRVHKRRNREYKKANELI